MSDNIPKDLYEAALDLLSRSAMLKETVIWQDKQADKLVKKYSDAEFDVMSDEDKMKHFKEVEELYGRLGQSVKELDKLDEEYEELRVRVKKKYGKDIMPPMTSMSSSLFGSGLSDKEIDLGGGV